MVPAEGPVTPLVLAYFLPEDFLPEDFFALVVAFRAVPLAVVLAFDTVGLRPERWARRAAPSRDAFAICLPRSGARLATVRPALATRLATGSAFSAMPFRAPGAFFDTVLATPGASLATRRPACATRLAAAGARSATSSSRRSAVPTTPFRCFAMPDPPRSDSFPRVCPI